MTLYVEGISPSASTGNSQINVILYAHGDPPRASGTDNVLVTVLGLEAVEGTGDISVEVRSSLKDSHPAPHFENVTIAFLGNPRPSGDGTRLLGSFEVTGRIRSAVCDLTPGEEGKIGGRSGGVLEDFLISLNGEPLPDPTIVVFNQPKSAGAPSFIKPYATYTEFDLVFNDVEVSTGLNWLRLAATDKARKWVRISTFDI